MRKLIAGTNIDVSDPTNYPNGRIQDETTPGISADGTVVNEIVNGDIIQFFQKLIIDAGTTENDLPDNVTNGYQLMAALNTVLLTGSLGVGTWQTPTYEANFSAGTPAFEYRLNKGRLEFRGEIVADAGADLAFTLPAAYRPAADVYIRTMSNSARSGFSITKIGSNGQVENDAYSGAAIPIYFNDVIIID